MPEDTAQAYEYLSQSLEACEEQQDECTTAAAGDAAKIAACESEAAACKQKTDAAAEHARDNLDRDSRSCWKRCRHGDDDAGIATNDDDAGTGDMDDCVGRHVPAIPACIFQLVGCLRGVGQNQASDPRSAVKACVDHADACFRDAFEARRREDRGNRGPGRRHDDGDQAGQGAPGSTPAGAAGSPGGAAGSPGGTAGSSAAANGGRAGASGSAAPSGGSGGAAGGEGNPSGRERGAGGRNGSDNGGHSPSGRDGKRFGRNWG